jgi:hypothetical protein
MSVLERPRKRGRSLRSPRPLGRASGNTRQSRYWSAKVTRRSNALDLEAGVFKKKDPRAIALSLKRSAENSRRRKAGAYRSAMSMLSFYINRAGRSLDAAQKRRLERAKNELRKLYGRPLGPDRAGIRIARPGSRSLSMIRKLKSGQYRLYSRKRDARSGKRKNLGTFKTREAAERHEREVQHFKRAR